MTKHYSEFKFNHTLTQYTDDTEVQEESMELVIIVMSSFDEGDFDYTYKIYDLAGDKDLTKTIEFLNKEFAMEIEYKINEEASTNMAEALYEWRNEGLI